MPNSDLTIERLEKALIRIRGIASITTYDGYFLAVPPEKALKECVAIASDALRDLSSEYSLESEK